MYKQYFLINTIRVENKINKLLSYPCNNGFAKVILVDNVKITRKILQKYYAKHWKNYSSSTLYSYWRESL